MKENRKGNKENKCRNTPTSKLYTFNDCKGETDSAKNIIINEEEIKRFTHKFARQKLDYEERVGELEGQVQKLNQYCSSLEREVEELEEQNRNIVLERNDIYECLEFRKQQCKCKQFEIRVRQNEEEISQLENEIQNLEEYIQSIEIQPESETKEYSILRIQYEHINEALSIEKQINAQLEQGLKETKLNEQQLMEEIHQCKTEILQLTSSRNNMEGVVGTCRKVINELKREVEEANGKVVEEWQIQQLVFQYQKEKFDLQQRLSAYQ